ncbi:hypothetical protein [Sphingomonas sp. LHG3406-1]|uniref:hypothetical protein n=1 Tax=Sphingomonas sp. LHG3406-1 TaxID=2804617 RepID=UPI002639C242|nr:hypothetical protein [Sphingomonas sp. LHG3406-1]
MNELNSGDTAARGELLVTLRYGLRQTIRLAEHLMSDPAAGGEAHGLLSRLRAIRRELDDMAIEGPDLRRANGDPIWSNSVDQRSIVRSS